MKQFIDDKYTHLSRDLDKIRQKHRMYISFSQSAASHAITLEILHNSLDELKNPRSPGDRIDIRFDELSDTIVISDNGRGIPTDKLELVLTTLNSGSNIDSGNKIELKSSILGRNGVGTLAMNALAEVCEVITYRGGTENKYLRLLFNEGEKIDQEEGKCDPSKHGLEVKFKPSKVLGKNTKIIWKDLENVLINLQFLNDKKIKITSHYTNKQGITEDRSYKSQPFENILLLRNDSKDTIVDKIKLNIKDTIVEEIGGIKLNRFIDMDIAFMYLNNLTPYIDSFSNGNNTIDNGSHIDGSIEGLCRYFQSVTKATISERENLDIKWDDVKTGLSIVVSLNTNMEEIYTSQTKHKVYNEELEKLIKDKTIESLQEYFKSNQAKLKEFISVIKINAKARREGDKTRNAVIKETMTNWSSYKMKNFDPCANRGKEYKEIFIAEGDSAKGSLKLARDPRFQAIFAVRGVSANVFRLDLEGILANKEFNDLIKVLGCNVGSKFDMNKLQYNKIIIASDADCDGLAIRSLLCSFLFKVFPEIVQDGRVYIAEPPLYEVDDKKHPYVIDKTDYMNRYVANAMKDYKVGSVDDKNNNQYLDKSALKKFLSETGTYVDDIQLLSQHYKINDNLLELIFYQFALLYADMLNDNELITSRLLKNINMESLMSNISERFNEIHYDYKDKIIKGIIDGKYQSIEISERLLKKGLPIIITLYKLIDFKNEFVLKSNKTGSELILTLLETLKVLKKYQPTILHRFKGLGQNNPHQLKEIVMDPNTRTLIRVQISDIENDMKVFQTLRGDTPFDRENRKIMMSKFVVDPANIDT